MKYSIIKYVKRLAIAKCAATYVADVPICASIKEMEIFTRGAL